MTDAEYNPDDVRFEDVANAIQNLACKNITSAFSPMTDGERYNALHQYAEWHPVPEWIPVSKETHAQRIATLARIYNLLSDPTDYDAIDNARTLLYNLIMESR